MPVADHALAEILDVSLLLRQQRAPGIHRPGHSRPKDGVASLAYVPTIDRPLRRLGAVVVRQRLALQSIARIARQISGGLGLCHLGLPIAFGASLASVARMSEAKSEAVISNRPGIP